MMLLRFDQALHRALSLRIAKYLHDTDASIARRIESAPKGVPIVIPEACDLYEQALTMLVTEVLCNVAAALREVFGPEADGKLGPIVEKALAKATEARGQMDAKRKERSS
jgi:hypothetical protein